MKILVTGTSGKVGAAVAREFLEHGYQVRALDKMPLDHELRARADEQYPDMLEVVYSDITDRMGLLRATEGCDSIAHLAAIPNPGRLDDILLQTNVVGTQYVLDAAEAHGIKRVALASSNCAFGLVFAKHPFEPQYVPLDEKHPDLPQDLYGLSKVMNELTAQAYTRRCGMTTISLRLTGVMKLDDEHSHWRKRQLVNGDKWRSGDFWTYIDLRDTVRAFRLSIEAPVEGSHTLLIAARDSYCVHDIRDLIRRHYPSMASYCDRLPDARSSAFDTRRAEELIGFVPQHSWRDVPELQEAENEWRESKTD